jgi:hypothetical protein
MASFIYSVDNPSHEQIKQLRKHGMHYLNPCISNAASISVQQMQQWAYGWLDLTPAQMHQLALATDFYKFYLKKVA